MDMGELVIRLTSIVIALADLMVQLVMMIIMTTYKGEAASWSSLVTLEPALHKQGNSHVC